MKAELGHTKDQVQKGKNLNEGFAQTVDPSKKRVANEIQQRFPGNESLMLEEEEFFTRYTVAELLKIQSNLPQNGETQLPKPAEKLLDKLKKGSFSPDISSPTFSALMHSFGFTLETLDLSLQIQYFLFHLMGPYKNDPVALTRIDEFKRGSDAARALCQKVHLTALEQISSVTAL